MKRYYLVATLATVATAGLATHCQASGAFGLFYCPKYCASYCQACAPHNAFSSNGCLLGCCPPPQWPQTGFGCGGCGAYNACPTGGCGTGPCCRNKPPHAMHLVTSSPQQFDPVCGMCGMASYGLGGMRQNVCGKGCKGKGCNGGCYYDGSIGYMGGIVDGAISYSTIPMWNYSMPNALSQYYWNTAQQNANLMQPVSYPGTNPVAPNQANWGYGYGYNPYYNMSMYNPALWGGPGYGYNPGW